MTAPMQSYTSNGINNKTEKKIFNPKSKKINKRDHEGRNALFFAIEEKNIEKIMFLVENESSLMVTRKKHALFHTISCNHFESVRYFIKKGIRVDIRNKRDQTPLIYATQYGRLNIACLLISFGADLYAVDMHLNMAIDLAEENSQLRDILTLKMA